MKYLVAPAQSDDDLRSIEELRYRIYVEELGIYGSLADHAGRRLPDSNDRSARLFLARNPADGSAVATARLHVGCDAPLPETYRQTYRVDRFSDIVPEAAMAVVTRLMCLPALRGTTLPFQMMAALCRSQIEGDVQLCFCDCEPHLIGLYARLGFRSYDAPYNSAYLDLLYPMVHVLIDAPYLEAIRSPLLAVARFPTGPESLRRELSSRIARHATAHSMAAATTEDVWSEQFGALTQNRPQRVPLFGGLDETEAREIAAEGQVILCKKGDTVLHTGQATRTLFVLLDGEVDVLVGDRRIGTHSRGEVFGEVAALLGGKRTATVVAASDTVRLLGLGEKALPKLANGGSRAAAKILFNLSTSLCEKLARLTRVAENKTAP